MRSEHRRSTRSVTAVVISALALVVACSSSNTTGQDGGLGDGTAPFDAGKKLDAAKRADASKGKDARTTADVGTSHDAPPATDVATTPDSTASADSGLDGAHAGDAAHDASGADAHDAAKSDAQDAAPLLGLGRVCSQGSQCTSTNCVDGVCCNTACIGTCQACSAAQKGTGTDGTCGVLAPGRPAPSGQCPAQGQATCGNDGNCGAGGVCEQWSATTSCGSAACSNAQLSPGAACNGSGTCVSAMTVSCSPFICASATACKTACASDGDCLSASDYCANPGPMGTCVGRGGSGASCFANDDCASQLCGTTGMGSRCCTAACSPLGGTCGATDCNAMGACAFPGNAVALPASQQTPGSCQKLVCNGAGGTTSIDDPTNLPSSHSACLVNPACCGPSPLTPCFTSAPTGTPCTSPSDPHAAVCGNTSNSNIAGTCVECNTDADCEDVNDAGTLICNTSTGTCQ